MLPELMQGTRTKQNFANQHPAETSVTSSLNTDKGLSKNVTASITFVNSATKQLQAANGTFNNFPINELILVEKTNLNNGIFTVVAIDAANHAFLTVDNPPKNEGPITATVRSL